MEIFWFIVAVATLVYGIKIILTVGWADGFPMLVMPIIAAAMWYVRRRYRKKVENNKN